jgi:low temperature requirement protein LtrA
MAVTPAPPASAPADLPEDREQRVTNLELFFDLVFVFAITQVTALMADDPTWRGLGAGMLVLGALWQAWVAYAWLTNAIDPDEDAARLIVFAAMAAMLVAALAAPGALGDHAVAFAVAYLVVRALHLFLYLQRTDDPGVHRAIRRMALPLLTSPLLLLAAALLLDGAALRWAWLGILVFDFSGVFLAGSEGWVVSASHFVERHGLVVIIALGESIVAVGAGAEGFDANVVAGAVLGVVVSAGLWWAYFDVVAVVAARRLAALHGAERARMARDSYSYLHLPMVAGIILLALGVKKVLGHPSEPLSTTAAVALCGGPALYFAAHVAFRLRNVRTWSVRRVVAVVVLLGLIGPATEVDALVSLALVAAVVAALTAYETLRYKGARARVRALAA